MVARRLSRCVQPARPRGDPADARTRRAPVGGGRGAEAWLSDIRDLLIAFPDYRWKRITLVVEGDRIAAHLRASGTHRGAFDGIASTGRHVNIAEFAFYRLEGGRIVEYAGGDGGALRRQLTG